MAVLFDTIRFAWRACQLQRAASVSSERLLDLQRRRLRDILHQAVTRSPFYRDKYRGIDVKRCRLEDLPTTNKSELMAHFDNVVTDRRIRRDDLERFMADTNNVPKLFSTATP